MKCPICKGSLFFTVQDKYSGTCSQGCEAMAEVDELKQRIKELEKENENKYNHGYLKGYSEGFDKGKQRKGK